MFVISTGRLKKALKGIKMVQGKLDNHKPPHTMELLHGESLKDGTAAFNLNEKAHLYPYMNRKERDEMAMLIVRMRERMLQPSSTIPEVLQSLITWRNPDIQKICRYRNILPLTQDEAQVLLRYSVDKDTPSIMRIALSFGARTDVRDAAQRLPEQRAAEKDSVRILRELSENGISLFQVYRGAANIPYHKGESLQHIAAKHNKYTTIEFLAAAGAYMHKPDDMGRSPARYAEAVGCRELAEELDEIPVLHVTM